MNPPSLHWYIHLQKLSIERSECGPRSHGTLVADPDLGRVCPLTGTQQPLVSNLAHCLDCSQWPLDPEEALSSQQSFALSSTFTSNSCESRTAWNIPVNLITKTFFLSFFPKGSCFVKVISKVGAGNALFVFPIHHTPHQEMRGLAFLD